jgi:hypothetical protein
MESSGVRRLGSPGKNAEIDLTGTSQPMLGVLFFPLSPPEPQRGHTHKTREKSSSQLASQGRATTLFSSWVSQLPQEKSVKEIPTA